MDLWRKVGSYISVSRGTLLNGDTLCTAAIVFEGSNDNNSKQQIVFDYYQSRPPPFLDTGTRSDAFAVQRNVVYTSARRSNFRAVLGQ